MWWERWDGTIWGVLHKEIATANDGIVMARRCGLDQPVLASFVNENFERQGAWWNIITELV